MAESAGVPQTDTGGGKHGRPASLWRLLGACLIVLASVTAAGFAGRTWWLFELFSHYRLQYVLCALAAGVLFAVGRRWRWGAFAAGVLVVNVLPVASLCIPPKPPTQDGFGLRVLFANLAYGNTDVEAVTAMVADADPDVIVFAEVTQFWARALAPLRAEYPTVSVAAREGAFGIGLLSRVASPAGHMEHYSEADLPTVLARLQADGRELRIVGIHSLPPIGPDAAADRNAHFAGVAAQVRGSAEPVILLGDLNCTPYSPYFRTLLADSGLKDARKGFGIKATWPAVLGPLGLPIDHCLVSAGIGVTSFALGPDVGSDHRPIIVDLVIP